MNNKKRKKMILLLFVIIVLIITFFIFNNIDKLSPNEQPKDVEETSKYVYNFGEPINLDSKYGYDGNELKGTDPDSNFGYISELYDDFSKWESDGNLIVETAHGYITYSKRWLDEGAGKLLTEPDFGYLDRFVLQEYIAKATYNNVSYDEAYEYAKNMKKKGFTINSKEEKNKKESFYTYKGDNENGEYFSIRLDGDTMVIQSAI